MKVGIYGQFYHKEAARYVQELLNILGQKKIEVIIEKNFLNLIKANDQIHVNYDHFSTFKELDSSCLLYTSPSPRDQRGSRMPSSA